MTKTEIKKIILEVLSKKIQNRDQFFAQVAKIAHKYKLSPPNTSQIREAYKELIAENPKNQWPNLLSFLKKREIRTLSGVAPVTVLTKPYPCPGKCLYCPNETKMPKSYLSNEPAAARALRLNFDPYRQTQERIKTLIKNGHPTDKIELIVKGGTWSAYPWNYQKWFIKRCFDACNTLSEPKKKAKTLKEAQKINENAKHRIVGLTLETRPDYITPQEIWRMRLLGCTRVELGVQTIDEKILKKIQRGHSVSDIALATFLLRTAGFKVDYHLMPMLPGSTFKKDLEMFQKIFSDERFKPDMIKIYPCVVTKNSKLYKLFLEKKYKPYSQKKFLDLLLKIKSEIIPYYCRISRIIRDIPADSIVAGIKKSNLREEVQKIMQEKGLKCPCLRCRELGHQMAFLAKKIKAKLFQEKYQTTGGQEIFLSVEDIRRQVVLAFCRLRLPEKNSLDPQVKKIYQLLPEIKDAALIRELHTYGSLLPIGSQNEKSAQHKGLGKKLVFQAEKIARQAGFKKMAIISGIGVRNYYQKLGYTLEGSYMVKYLN